jgi:hypothetical protein
MHQRAASSLVTIAPARAIPRNRADRVLQRASLGRGAGVARAATILALAAVAGIGALMLWGETIPVEGGSAALPHSLLALLRAF